MKQGLVEARLKLICYHQDPLCGVLKRFSDVSGIRRIHVLFGVFLLINGDCARECYQYAKAQVLLSHHFIKRLLIEHGMGAGVSNYHRFSLSCNLVGGDPTKVIDNNMCFALDRKLMLIDVLQHQSPRLELFYFLFVVGFLVFD